MYNYRVAFIVNGKQLNARFVSPMEYSDDASRKAYFREMATLAVQEYMRENRTYAGKAEALAIWPDILPCEGVNQPLDAFEII